MPKISNRGKLMISSPIRSLIPSARKAKLKGTSIFHLNIGQPDISTPPEALKAVSNHYSTTIKYGPSEGYQSLRSTMAEYYKRFQVTLESDHIYVTTGASEAILFALMACCDQYSEIIIPEPFYANYLGFAGMAHLNIVPVTTKIETSFALPSVEEIESKITSETQAILICNPGNPTGQLYMEDDLKELIHLAIRKDIFLIVDEVYREFCYEKPFTSALFFENGAKHVIAIDSISKIFSSCGARIGSIATKNEEVLHTINKYAQLRLSPPHYGQILAEACYQNIEPYISKVRSQYKVRRNVLYEELNKAGIENMYKPDAAFYNMVPLPIEDSTAFSSWMLSDFSHKGKSVMLAPGSGFYVHQELGRNQVRIAYILDIEKLREAIECLVLGLEKYQRLGSNNQKNNHLTTNAY
ncbi:MAG TPA: pyridoxal phosphate-dependent aminotransferase [Saprospiraceae bacterium]|nr:pyridoxal phosphate-dependent aminotransferase [Saprospiraceae bacterium]